MVFINRVYECDIKHSFCFLAMLLQRVNINNCRVEESYLVNEHFHIFQPSAIGAHNQHCFNHSNDEHLDNEFLSIVTSVCNSTLPQALDLLYRLASVHKGCLTAFPIYENSKKYFTPSNIPILLAPSPVPTMFLLHP